MSGNDQRATFLVVFVDGFVKNVVQCRNLSLHGAAILDVDERILSCCKDVTRDDDIGSAEMHDAIAIRDRIRLEKDFNRFSVLKLPSSPRQKRVAGPARRGCTGHAHTVLNSLIPDNGRSLTRVGELVREKRSDQTRVRASCMNF